MSLQEEILQNKSIALLLKRSSEELPSAIDEVICQMVYGNIREPPGDENCPFQILHSTNESGEEISGIWVPLNSLSKAVALKVLFPNISAPYLLPEVSPIPPHVAVGYDAFKYKDVLELATHYPGEVMKYGLFTSDIPGEAQLIAKTVDKFENRAEPPTYEEKIVIQLAKTNSDCILAFSELGPSYMSPNAAQGEQECKIFFPVGYDEPEKTVTEVKKKSKKKGKAKPAVVVEAPESEISQATEERETSTEIVGESEADHVDGEENALGETGDGDEHTSDEKDGDEEENDAEGADKATSPMHDDKDEN